MGLPGVGKSSVALSIAKRVRGDDGVVWWINGSSSESIEQSFRSLGVFDLGLTELGRKGVSAIELADRVWEKLSQLPGPRWLIFDQVDTPDDLLTISGEESTRGRSWIRSQWSGACLITSRNGLPDAWNGFSQSVVEPLLGSDSAQVLLDLAPSGGSSIEATELAQYLGGLPLALSAVGKHLGSPYTKIRLFKDYKTVFLKGAAPALSELADQEISPTRPTAIVERIVEISLRAGGKWQRRSAKSLLFVLATFSPSTPVPTELLDDVIFSGFYGRRSWSVAESVKVLTSGGLVSLMDGGPLLGPSVVMHPLVARLVWSKKDEMMAKAVPNRRGYAWMDMDAIGSSMIAVQFLYKYLRERHAVIPGGVKIIVGEAIGTAEPILMISPSNNEVASQGVDLVEIERAYGRIASHVIEILLFQRDYLYDEDLAAALRSAAYCFSALNAAGRYERKMLDLISFLLGERGGSMSRQVARLNSKMSAVDESFNFTSRLI